MNEDQARNRKGNGPENMALLRRLALDLAKLEGSPASAQLDAIALLINHPRVGPGFLKLIFIGELPSCRYFRRSARRTPQNAARAMNAPQS